MLKLGDVQETALIPLAVRAEETKRKNARIHDLKAVKIIDDLYVDTKKYNKFFSHEGVVARTVMIDREVKNLLKNILTQYASTLAADWTTDFHALITERYSGSILTCPTPSKYEKRYLKKPNVSICLREIFLKIAGQRRYRKDTLLS